MLLGLGNFVSSSCVVLRGADTCGSSVSASCTEQLLFVTPAKAPARLSSSCGYSVSCERVFVFHKAEMKMGLAYHRIIATMRWHGLELHVGFNLWQVFEAVTASCTTGDRPDGHDLSGQPRDATGLSSHGQSCSWSFRAPSLAALSLQLRESLVVAFIHK